MLNRKSFATLPKDAKNLLERDSRKIYIELKEIDRYIEFKLAT